MKKDLEFYKEIIEDYQDAVKLLNQALRLKDEVIEGLTANKKESSMLQQCKALSMKSRKPTIIKSGDTWVAEWKGVDYLMVQSHGGISFELDIPRWDREVFEKSLKRNEWKPISEIEITDEIAKLRPKLIEDWDNGEIHDVVFMGLRRGVLYHDDGASTLSTTKHSFRLATVKDLQES